MVQQVTKGIKISVETSYEGAFNKNRSIHYAFVYQITIKNESKELVQLLTREWQILDALNHAETVIGEGVIGQKPIIKPGDSYSYSSGCILTSPYGAMHGYYNMINLTTSTFFKVTIPSFKLNATFALN